MRIVLVGQVGEFLLEAAKTESAVALVSAHTVRPSELADAIKSPKFGLQPQTCNLEMRSVTHPALTQHSRTR